MNFARDNDLRILDCQALLDEQEHSQIPLKNAIKQRNSTQQTIDTDQATVSAT